MSEAAARDDDTLRCPLGLYRFVKASDPVDGGFEYTYGDFDTRWRVLPFNQFHSVFPESSVSASTSTAHGRATVRDDGERGRHRPQRGRPLTVDGVSSP